MSQSNKPNHAIRVASASLILALDRDLEISSTNEQRHEIVSWLVKELERKAEKFALGHAVYFQVKSVGKGCITLVVDAYAVIVIAAAASATYKFIVDYPKLREGVQLIVKDLSTFYCQIGNNERKVVPVKRKIDFDEVKSSCEEAVEMIRNRNSH